MKLLDLFSGIGGFSVGLERAGFQTVAFCEADPYCRRVLAKHWPKVPIHDDVRHLDAAWLRDRGIGDIDAICGGFPCQDISFAGAGAGLDGERSGLWREFARLIGELRPRHAIVENVGALRARGLADVLADLAALGYDAEWHAIPAAAVGAPHLRDRVWIVASDAVRCGREGWADGRPVGALDEQRAPADFDPDARSDAGGRRPGEDPAAAREDQGHRHQRQRVRPESGAVGGDQLDDAAAKPGRSGSPQLRGLFGPLARALAAASAPWERSPESPLRGMDDGVPSRLDAPRLKALGNAVVPQIPEIIGRAILESA